MSLALPSTSKERANSSEATLDALPYIDDVNYNESHRQLALQLIQAELRSFPKSKNYLRHLPEPKYNQFLTKRILNQFEQISGKKEPEKIDLHRYEVPAPTGTKANEKRAWQFAQLGNQYLRKINLELMEQYGGEAHLQFNKELQRTVDVEEAQINQLRNRLYEMNARRKRTQLAAGEQIQQLNRSWVNLVSKNARMEVELDNLEKEIVATAKRLKVEPEIEKKY